MSDKTKSGFLKEFRALVESAWSDETTRTWDLRPGGQSLDTIAERAERDWGDGIIGGGGIIIPRAMEGRSEIVAALASLQAAKWIDQLHLLLVARTGSQIEELLLCGLLVVAWKRSADVIVTDGGDRQLANLTLAGGSGERLVIKLQAPLGRYRADFLLTYTDYDSWMGAEHSKRVVIECDGHDFHERTKEQVRHDKARDRAITALDLPMLRFAGSEIFAAPIAKAEEAVTYVSQSMWRDAWTREFRTAGEVAFRDRMRHEVSDLGGDLERRTGLSPKQWAERLGFKLKADE